MTQKNPGGRMHAHTHIHQAKIVTAQGGLRKISTHFLFSLIKVNVYSKGGKMPPLRKCFLSLCKKLSCLLHNSLFC